MDTITHAIETADDAVKNGLFATWSLVDDEGPYYGDTEAALRGMVFGDEHVTAIEPWASDVEDVPEDDMDEWVATWRERVYELGCIELGIE